MSARAVKRCNGRLVILDENGKTIATQKPKRVPTKVRRRSVIKVRDSKFALTESIRSKAVNMVIEDMYRKDIAKALGVPYSRFTYWFAKHPDFRKDMEEAEKVRAAHFRDKYAQQVEAVKKKSEVPVAKLKMQGYEKLAEWDDPAKYGSKHTVEGNPDKPLTLIIDTGIRRKQIKDVESEKE